MENDILYEESQYLGYNRLSFLRRMVLALFCFLSYYWSGDSVDAEGSGSLLFFLGVAIIGVSAILVFILHYRTKVENGSLVLDGLWTARKVKIDLSSIKGVSKVKYSRFFLIGQYITYTLKEQSIFIQEVKSVYSLPIKMV